MNSILGLCCIAKHYYDYGPSAAAGRRWLAAQHGARLDDVRVQARAGQGRAADVREPAPAAGPRLQLPGTLS